MAAPLAVHPDRRKAARGAIASSLLVVFCVVAAGRGEPVVGIGAGALFALCTHNLAKIALSREPALVADGAGIRAPRCDVGAAWSEVVAVVYEKTAVYSTTVHTLRVFVRDGQALLRRRSEAVRLGRMDRGTLVRHDRLDVQLDDLSMPPAEIAAAVEELFRIAAAPDSLETAGGEAERVVRRRGSAAPVA